MAHTHRQTEIYHTANGSTTSFSYPFEYYQKSDVHVTVNGTAKTQGTHYDVTGTNVVFKTSPTDYTPANTEVVRVYRDTDVNTSKATFAPGSSIRATDLNNNETQLLFSVQEGVDQEIVTADIRDGQITSDKIKDGAVTADQIGANALTYAKIQNVSATNRVLGRDSSGAGIIEEITPANLRTMINVEDGAQANPTNAEIRTAVEAASDSNVFTDADHTKLDGIAAGAEVNVQADWNSSSGDNQILNKPTIPTLIDEDNFSSDDATKAPSQQSTKAYITATSQPLDGELTELATMDSGTASALADLTTAEVQILDGATVTTAELNILDGVTSTTAELNYVDGVTSNVQTQLDAKQPLDGDLTTLAGAASGTASIIGDSSKTLTADIDELNLLDGKSIVTSISGSSTDVQIPSAKAVNDQIVATLQDVGGFYPIDDELKFPNTNPDPNNDAGTIVSIADAGGIVVNGSGVSTTGRTLGGTTVTINGIDSTLNNTTIAAGKGMLVQTTSTLNTYTYHRLVVDEAGVASAQTLVSDFNQRYQVANSQPSNQPDGTALVEGDLWFDEGTNKMKVYDGSNYSEVTSVGDYKLLTVVPDGATSGSPNYTNTSFDLRDGSNAASITSVGQLLVSVNGVLQKPNSGSYSSSNEGFHLEGTNGIKFCTAPGSGASVFVTLIGSATGVNTPATNSIVEDAIQSNVVSEVKLKIHQNPSDGKFLKYTSANGMEWGDVPAGVGGATGADFNDDVKLRFGDGNDMEIYTASNNSGQIKSSSGIGLTTTGAATQASLNAYNTGSSASQVVVTADSGANTKATLRYNTNEKLATTNTGIAVTGGVTTTTASTFVGDVTFDNGTNAGRDITWDESADRLYFKDNTFIHMGTTEHCTIGHNGTYSFLVSNNDKLMLGPTGAAGTELLWGNSKKAETVTGGFTVTGVCTATSFAGDGSSLTGVAASSADGCMYKNTLTISNNHTIAATEGAHSVGPITNNATVTVNGRWVIS